MKKPVSFIVLLLALAACETTTSETVLTSTREALQSPDAWSMGDNTAGEVQVGWIETLNDPVLSALVREAQANNRDLQAAAAAVAQARALARQARAALIPAVNVTVGAGEAGIIDLQSAEFYSLGTQVSWEVDVWGRVRSNKRAAAFSAYSAEADFLFSQYSLAATVAQTYFLVIEAGLQLEVSIKSFNALQETDRIVSAQREIGIATALDVALSHSDLASARASVAQAEGAQRDAIRALEVLIGSYPATGLEIRQTLPDLPPLPPAGLPSVLLERRPDVIAAELNVASTFNSVRAARAARLPTISLTGVTEGSSPELSDILDTGNVTWQLAGNLLGPLIDGGLRKAQVDQANASQQQAIANYAQTALRAFQDVEGSLDQNEVLRIRADALREAASQANRALEIAQLRYQEGETDILDVLTIQSRVFSADQARVSVERAQLDEWINLNLALGGAW